MTLLAFLFILFSECCSVAGQVLMKHAMAGESAPGHKKNTRLVMTSAIVVLALGFFSWTGLMSRFDLSYLYPFDGLNRILLVLAASIFLKEKMTLNLWVGVLLICAGVLLVSGS